MRHGKQGPPWRTAFSLPAVGADGYYDVIITAGPAAGFARRYAGRVG